MVFARPVQCGARRVAPNVRLAGAADHDIWHLHPRLHGRPQGALRVQWRVHSQTQDHTNVLAGARTIYRAAEQTAAQVCYQLLQASAAWL